MQAGQKRARYCCYRHFLEGKQAKDSTFCDSHVPLGVINPLPQNKPLGNRFVPQSMAVESRPYRIQNRTHDYNEIEHRNTLPDRLAQPRVYIEKLVPRGTPNQVSLSSAKRSTIKARYYNSDYDTMCEFYKTINSVLKTKTKQQLQSVVQSHMRKHNIETGKLIIKTRFLQLLQKQFNFTPAQAEQFWHLAYNDLRFRHMGADRQCLSIRAFVHNMEIFKPSQHFVNMLSQAALKQRMIDIRHFLHQWARNNIYLKLKLKSQREQEIRLCEYLGSESCLATDLHSIYTDLISNRNNLYFKLRILAKFLYRVTDNKFLTFDKLKQVICERVTQRTQQLEVSHEVLTKFIEIKQYDNQQQFPVTEILEFMRIEGDQEEHMAVMTKWLRNLLKYLFYDAVAEESGRALPAISFNPQTLSLQCNELITVNLELLRQFQCHHKDMNDHAVAIIEELVEQVQNNLQHQMPEIQGHKKLTLQCNYIAETILKILRQCKLSYFYICNRIIRQCYDSIMAEGHVQVLSHLLTDLQTMKLNNDSSDIKRQMKRMFIWENNVENSEFESVQEQKLRAAFEQYKQVSENNQLLKKNNSTNQLKKRKPQPRGSKTSDRPLEFPDCQLNAEEIYSNTECDIHDNDVYCSLNASHVHKERDCCILVSPETRSSISAVESLESQLFDLLSS